MEDILANLVVDLVRIATRIFIGISGMMALVLISRWLDVRAGVPFSEVAATIRKSPAAAAEYYGKRIIAMAMVIVAAIFG